jgi:FtsZ-interacting cell division protein ZipA
VRITLVIVIVVAVVVVLGLLGLISRRRTRPLARHLRSTTFSQRRSDRIKRAAAEDVAVEQDDEYYRRARRGDPDPDNEI